MWPSALTTVERVRVEKESRAGLKRGQREAAIRSVTILRHVDAVHGCGDVREVKSRYSSA